MAVQILCKGSTPACRGSCLTNSGMMRMPIPTNARAKRTDMFLNDNVAFMAQLSKEIDSLIKTATKQGKKLALRLNGTSDLDWTDVYNKYPEVQFYEYTKRLDLVKKAKNIANLHMTFSRSEVTKDSTIVQLVESGVNVAVVFDDKKVKPTTYLGFAVIDGDTHDRRFEDEKGNIIGLKLKGTLKAKSIARASGFAV